MGEIVLIYGKSGAGKSRSLINFGEDEATLIQVVNKRLPFPKKFKNTKHTDSVREIAQVLNEMKTKAAIIDDAGYLMTNAFMRGHQQGDQFKLYNTIADGMFCLFDICKKLPEEVITYVIFHEETDDMGNSKLRTIGKLLDQKVCLEGMVTICLRCVVKNGQHVFITHSDGYDIAKAPEGMFEEEIPNDLKAVDSTIRKYYGIKEKK